MWNGSWYIRQFHIVDNHFHSTGEPTNWSRPNTIDRILARTAGHSKFEKIEAREIPAKRQKAGVY
jgi:hypothetical protein